MDTKTSATNEEQTALTSRELDLLSHYHDPTSPAYQNGTRAAELAGYKGLPGSNQLAVQACRTLNKARKLGVLLPIMLEKRCLLERAIERLSDCLDAKRKRVFMTKDGQIVEGPLEDNLPLQLQAAKAIFVVYGAFAFAATSRRGLSPVVTCQETESPDQEQVSEEHRSAMAIVSQSAVVDRESLRDVLECDATSVKLESREPQSETAERPGQGPVLQDDPSKA